MKMCNGSRVPRPTTTQKVAQTAMTVQQQQQYVHKSLPEVPAMTMDDEYEPQVAAPEHPVYLKPKKIVQKRAVVAPVAVPSPEPVYDEDFEQEEEDEEEDEYEEEVPSRVANNAAPAGNPLYQEVQDRTPCNICGRKFSQDALV